jgi:hypothetical protein
VADETTAGPAPAGPPPTPELDRQRQAIEDGAHRIGEFLDWLGEQGYHLAKYYDGRSYDANPGPQNLVAGFYRIDLDKIEAERRALLAYIRSTQ